MSISAFECCEYENGYDTEYGGIYDINFVFYDDEEEEEESFDDYGEEFESEDDEPEDDIILDEVPFVYCPTRGDAGEA